MSAEMWAELRTELGRRRESTYTVALDLDDEGNDGALKTFGHVDGLDEALAVMDHMAARAEPPLCRVCNDTGVVWSPDLDRESAYESACPEPVHRAPQPSAEVAVPHAIEGTLAPEDIIRANMRAARFPIDSAADAARIHADAEQWAQDFAAQCRAEDPIMLGHGTEGSPVTRHPTPQGISALLAEAAHPRAGQVPVPGGWSFTDGFEVSGDPHGVRVRFRFMRIMPGHDPAVAKAATRSYARTITGAGWAVEAGDYELFVTAPKTED